MAPRRVLDTNILSDLLKNPAGKAARKIASLDAEGRESLATSVIVASDLRYGAAKSGSAVLAERVEQLLAAIDVLALEADADRHYGVIRARLERAGTVIGANDLLIAAHVLALDAILVTDNVRDFKRVEGLRVENWLRS